MCAKSHNCDRRTVLKTAAGSLALAGIAGVATADDSMCRTPEFEEGDEVITNGETGYARGYSDCGAVHEPIMLENGRCGVVRDGCCFEGELRYFVAFEEHEEYYWIPEDDLSLCYSTD